MNFVVLFEDNPNPGADIRRKHMPDHLSFLEENAGRIMTAGPLKSEEGLPAGGLWIVTAETRDEVRALVEADPFWPTGLRKSVRILEWMQVFAKGKRLI